MNRIIFLTITVLVLFSVRIFGQSPVNNCKKHLDGVFVYNLNDPNYLVARTDTNIIEVISGEIKCMVRYKVKWSENGCDHDLIYERTTPPLVGDTRRKGEVIHIKVIEATNKFVSYTATYKNVEQQMKMYRVE